MPKPKSEKHKQEHSEQKYVRSAAIAPDDPAAEVRPPGLTLSDRRAWKACATDAGGHGTRWTRLLTSHFRPAIHPPTNSTEVRH